MIEIDRMRVTYKNGFRLSIDQRVSLADDDVLGVIGENGAGKSTLINAIIGELEHSGLVRAPDPRRIGILFQQNKYNPLMKVSEIIRIVAGTPDALNDPELQEFELDRHLWKPIGTLSGGEKQRLSLYLVLRRAEPLYIFDEMTTGLDFLKRRRMIELAQEKTRGVATILVTPYLDEVLGWATKLLVLHKGRVAFFGDCAELLAVREKVVTIRADSNTGGAVDKLLDRFPGEGVVPVPTGDGSLELHCPTGLVREVEDFLRGAGAENTVSSVTLSSAYRRLLAGIER